MLRSAARLRVRRVQAHALAVVQLVLAREHAGVELRELVVRDHALVEPEAAHVVEVAARREPDALGVPGAAASTGYGASEAPRGVCWHRYTVDAAGAILDELATGWSRFSVDLSPSFSRFLYGRGFDPQIDYDTDQVETMRTALETHPAVMLWSHRSNLDSAVLTVALQENQLPRAHLFAGINMSFGFMGPLLRRSGVIFIRRNVGSDPVDLGPLVGERFRTVASSDHDGSSATVLAPDAAIWVANV